MVDEAEASIEAVVAEVFLAVVVEMQIAAVAVVPRMRIPPLSPLAQVHHPVQHLLAPKVLPVPSQS